MEHVESVTDISTDIGEILMDRAEIQSFCDNYKYVSRRRNWSEGELTPTRDPDTGYVAKVVLDLRMSYVSA